MFSFSFYFNLLLSFFLRIMFGIQSDMVEHVFHFFGQDNSLNEFSHESPKKSAKFARIYLNC